MVCHSPLQWTTFCQNSPPWPACLGWPHKAWLSFIELDKAVVLVELDWLVFCEYGFSMFALWCPLATPTMLLEFLLPWTWGISSWLFKQRAAITPYIARGVSTHHHPSRPWMLSSSFWHSCPVQPQIYKKNKNICFKIYLCDFSGLGLGIIITFSNNFIYLFLAVLCLGCFMGLLVCLFVLSCREHELFCSQCAGFLLRWLLSLQSRPLGHLHFRSCSTWTQ